jgi:hypothetical protein
MKIQSYIPLALLTAFFYSSSLFGQSLNHNYIHSWDVKVSGYSNPNTLNTSTNTRNAIQTIQYFDGLGRLSQTVMPGYSTDSNSLISPKKYNNVGLDEINFQPYVASTGDNIYRTGFEDELSSFYSENYDNDPYGKAPVEYEKSPLHRVLQQGAPGADWQLDTGHPVKFQYLTNSTSQDDLKVVFWKVGEN